MKCSLCMRGKRLIALAATTGFLSTSAVAREVVHEVAVNTDSLNQDETCIAVHPLADSLLAASWASCHTYPAEGWNAGFGFSFDGGRGWATGIIPDIDQTLTEIGDASCVFDDSSSAYFCYIAHPSNSLNGPVYIARTSDFGESWDFFQVSGDQTVGNDRPYIAVDNLSNDYRGNLYIAWSHAQGPPGEKTHQIEISHSSSHGETWSEAYTLDIGSPSLLEELSAALPCVGIDGTVYAAWLYLRGGDSPVREIRLARSTDGGSSFTDPITAISSLNLFFLKEYGNIHYRSWPTIAADRTDSSIVYLSFLLEDSPDEANVYFLKSTDQGETWSDPVIPVENVAGTQYHPWLSCAPGGALYLVYGDIADPQVSLANIYTAVSLDQGETFLTPSVRVNSVSSNPDVGGVFGNDYQGIASSRGKAFPCWTDYRNGTEDIYSAVVDLFRSGETDPGETWSQLVVMTGDVTVPRDDTLSLRIESGTEETGIYSLADSDDQSGSLDTSRCELIVEGSLRALGNDSSLVRFRSAGVSPMPGDWYGIRLRSGPDSLDWCEIQHAYIGVRSEGSSASIADCRFFANELSGVGSSPGSELSITGSFFEGAEQYSIGLLRPLYAEIAGNEFYGNGDYAIYLTAGDDEAGEIYLADNLIEKETGDTAGYDYGIYFTLVNGGSTGPVHLEITGPNQVRDCRQTGIRIEAPASLTALDASSKIDSATVTGNYDGIEISGGLNLALSWNDILSNENKGIFTSHYYPVLGDTAAGKGMNNRIYGNAVYEVYVETNIPNYPLKAQMNWWGDSGGPDPGKLYGNILYDPFLTTEP